MANKPAPGVELGVKPTTQLDAERRYALENGENPDPDITPRTFTVEGNDTSAYVGVSPEYQGYADESSKPFRAEEGIEKVVEEKLLSDDVAVQTQPSTVVDGAPNSGVGAPPVQATSEPEPEPEPKSKSGAKE